MLHKKDQPRVASWIYYSTTFCSHFIQHFPFIYHSFLYLCYPALQLTNKLYLFENQNLLIFYALFQRLFLQLRILVYDGIFEAVMAAVHELELSGLLGP